MTAVLTDPTLARHARAFRTALSEFVRIVQFRNRDCICCHDISVTQCNALDVLGSRGSRTLNALAAALYLDKSTTSRVVDALVKKGYVRRVPHPEDRRAVLIEATAQGSTLFHRIERELLDEQKHLLAEFDPEVREAMTALISKLSRSAATRIRTTGGSCCTTA